MSIWSIFWLLGGVGMFLFGMKILSDGLEHIAGDKLRNFLEKMTGNPIKGAIAGTCITAVMQSSSATTVMVVGFINAGMMTLSQAAGVIMGANIGTTITAQLIAFKIGRLAPLAIAAGVVMLQFIRRKRVNDIGTIVLGFGVLFAGMEIMSSAIGPLSEDVSFQNFLLKYDSPLLALLTGLLFCMVIQSSAATIGVVQTFVMQGAMSLYTAVFIVMGSNIGTCITAVLASASSGRESKRAALIHILFNMSGSLLFCAIVGLIPSTLTLLERLTPDNLSMQVANFHMVFNIGTTLLLLPFTNIMVRIAQKLMPQRKNEIVIHRRLKYLDSSVHLTSVIAIPQATREVCRMGAIATGNLKLALEAFFENNEAKALTVLDTEETIDYLNHEITGRLVSFQGMDLSDRDNQRLGMMFHVVADIERLGDHAENIAEYAKLESGQKAQFSQTAMAELHDIADKSIAVVELCLNVYESNALERIPEVTAAEEEIDMLREKYIDNHVQRLMHETCDPRGGVVFTEMLTDLERCSDHATNIAYALLGEPKQWNLTHSRLPQISTDD